MIELDECIVGGIYTVKARNFEKAVYVGNGWFAGIRFKFGQRFIDYEEYHGEKTGTAIPKELVGHLTMNRYPIPYEHGTYKEEEKKIFEVLDDKEKGDSCECVTS